MLFVDDWCMVMNLVVGFVRMGRCEVFHVCLLCCFGVGCRCWLFCVGFCVVVGYFSLWRWLTVNWF